LDDRLSGGGVEGGSDVLGSEVDGGFASGGRGRVDVGEEEGEEIGFGDGSEGGDVLLT